MRDTWRSEEDVLLDIYAEEPHEFIPGAYQHLQGLSLFELAVALLAVGIVFGVALKTREVIHQRHVSGLLERVSEVEASWYAFHDRFAMWPGENTGDTLPLAQVSLSDFRRWDGHNNNDNNVKSTLKPNQIWLQLLQAGFLTANVDLLNPNGAVSVSRMSDEVLADSVSHCAVGPCVSNGYGGFFSIVWRENQYELLLGQGIPIDVLYQLDRRIDDGLPLSGKIQVTMKSGMDTHVSGAPQSVEPCQREPYYNLDVDHPFCVGVLRTMGG